MMRKPMNTTVMIGSNADVTERAIATDGADVVEDIVRHPSMIDRPDEILPRLRRVRGHAEIPVGAAPARSAAPLDVVMTNPVGG